MQFTQFCAFKSGNTEIVEIEYNWRLSFAFKRVFRVSKNNLFRQNLIGCLVAFNHMFNFEDARNKITDSSTTSVPSSTYSEISLSLLKAPSSASWITLRVGSLKSFGHATMATESRYFSSTTKARTVTFIWQFRMSQDSFFFICQRRLTNDGESTPSEQS